MTKLKFQSLAIWQGAIAKGNRLIAISEQLEQTRKYRFAEQLRGAALSVSNKIGEGSGSSSDADFKQLLNYAHRSVFENANILIVLNLRSLASDKDLSELLVDLEILARMITSFSKQLIK